MKLWIALADTAYYEQSLGMVLRAETEDDARAQIAEWASNPNDRPQTWDVQPLAVDGPRGVLLIADQGE